MVHPTLPTSGDVGQWPNPPSARPWQLRRKRSSGNTSRPLAPWRSGVLGRLALVVRGRSVVPVLLFWWFYSLGLTKRPFGSFWGLFFTFSRVLKQILVVVLLKGRQKMSKEECWGRWGFWLWHIWKLEVIRIEIIHQTYSNRFMPLYRERPISYIV